MSNDSFQAPSIETLGETLPQYEFHGFIAQGGMGAVYKARQISLDRDVAIKILPQELGEDAEFRESFAKEAKAMAKLNHPNLIGVYDSGDVDGMPYIVMEYIEGSSLHDSCWGQEVEATQAVTIIKGICDGLADAHEHGIIHRDIKPANILLNTKAVPKIGDFGLAHPTDSEESGLVMGTPGYTAPEVFTDPNQAGCLADIYSVGMIFHQMLTGTDPTGTKGPPMQATGNIRLDAIWRKATQINPRDRYQSATAMAGDLEKWMQSKTGALVTSSAPANFTPSFQAQSRPAGASVIATQPSGNGGMLMKVAAIGVLLAAVWFTYGLLQDNKDTINEKITGSEDTETPAAPTPTPTDPVNTAPPQDPVTPTSPVVSNPTQPEPVDPDPIVAISPKDPVIPDPAIPDPVDPDPVVVANPEPKEELPPGDLEMREKAITLILNAREKRDQLLKKNANSFQLSLEAAARIASQSEASFLQGFINACDSGWVPEPDSVPELSRVVKIKYEAAHRDQIAILEKHESELTRIRDHYVPMLQEAADACSDEKLKAKLIAQANRATDLEPWVSLLAPEPEREPIVIKPGAIGGDDFVGIWDVTSDNFLQYDIKEDGTFVVVGRGWKGTWEKLSNGSIKVQLSSKKPWIISRDGNGWSGPYTDKKNIRFTPTGEAPVTNDELAAGVGRRSELLDFSKDFVGKWDSYTGPVTKWVAEKNGHLTILDDNLKPRTWSGKWKAMPRGVIWVRITDKEPYLLVKDGDGWKSHNNRKIELKPADW